MRVVIDTNIFVSSFFGGKPRQIVDLWKEGRFTLCLSSAILDEYMAVLQRTRLDRNELRELLEFFGRGWNTVFTATISPLRVVKEDPDDDKFIECAVALKAGIVVTGDKALLSVGRYQHVRIITPSVFLTEVSDNR